MVWGSDAKYINNIEAQLYFQTTEATTLKVCDKTKTTKLKNAPAWASVYNKEKERNRVEEEKDNYEMMGNKQGKGSQLQW